MNDDELNRLNSDSLAGELFAEAILSRMPQIRDCNNFAEALNAEADALTKIREKDLAIRSLPSVGDIYKDLSRKER